MIDFIKAYLPGPLKSYLKILKRNTFDRISGRLKINRVRLRHAYLVDELAQRKRIKVVFLAVHKSVWKVDALYQIMAADPFFEPEVLVCPYTSFGHERMREELEKTYEYFKTKGYSVEKSIKDDGQIVRLRDLDPDIVVFTNPHNLTLKEYYQDAYSRYLSIYVPYYYMATNHVGDAQEELDTLMLNSMWRIYWPHKYIFDKFSVVSRIQGRNSKLTGYPATEMLLKCDLPAEGDVWKMQINKKKKIIYAPHHSISDDNSSLSTFLRLGMVMKQLAEQYADFVQWSFKPHPILKAKLYLHPDWGKERTDEYYEFWSNQAHTQLDEGEYEYLFMHSDAIIHDCSSFIVEYAVTGKPGLYLKNGTRSDMDFLNDFGKCVFERYRTANSEAEISDFILDLVRDKSFHENSDSSCFNRYLSEFYDEELPSEKIIKDIKSALTKSYH
ncbi:CDP-Glycerol:Poly(glycerophosphate) glycerophosphotransferase [Marinobacter daqiaonensis]|uniref:CDP-Glycerol:Poly(Glycerophosphate) glycerophosphotransferase n=1 Tax=Marinobacter daqiaonensis TaxID=650891 RepID=A0A1I6H9E0_9GAMM|nr:CDP-glycerol glycerophosphotransferase family protein [Marinobacter daqiaonensis]SFR51129.1 CDP-Glycerol:Poly(glycerophosphate) glycerophosphotransferase [Marinobacter daqiaonensis]